MKKALKVGQVFLLLILFAIFANAEFVIDEVSYGSQSTEKLELTNTESGNVIEEHEFIVLDAPLSTQINLDLVSATSVSSIFVDSCNYATYEILLKNPNYEPVNINIEANSDLVEISEENFLLDKRSEKTITAFVKAPCNSEGEYNLETEIKIGLQGVEIVKTLKQEIKILEVDNLKVSYVEEEQGLPCETIVFGASVENTGSFSEDYKLTSSNTNVEIIPNLFSLDAGDSQNVKIEYIRTCEVYGKKEFTVYAEAIKNKREVNLPLTAIIKKEYNFSVKGDENISACHEEEITKTYTLTNNAHIPNSFTISKKGADFVELSGNYMELDAGESGTFDLVINPEVIKNKTLTLTIESGIGDTQIVQEIPIEVKDCYEIEIIEEKEQVCKYDEKFAFEIKNSGLYKEKVNISIEASEALTFPQIVEIEAGETKEISVSVEEDFEKSFVAKIVAKVERNPRIEESAKILVKKSSDKTCYNFEISPKKTNLSNTEMTITNTGLRNGTYNLEVYDNNNITSIDKKIFNLNVGENDTFNLKVSNTSIANQFALIQGKTHNFTKDAYVKINHTGSLIWLWILLIIIILLLLLILLVLLLRGKGKKKSKKERVKNYKNKRSWKWLWLVLAVIFLLLIIPIWIGCGKQISERNNSTEVIEFNELTETIGENETHKMMYMNSPWKFNLGRMFFDPDEDKLNYTAETDNNITIEITGSRAKVVPDHNVSGKRTVQFFAEDPDGEVAESPDVNLYIRPFENPIKTCFWRIVGTIVLIILAIFCIARFFK